MMAKNLSISQWLHWFFFDAHNLLWQCRMRQVAYAMTLESGRKFETKGNEAETTLYNDKKSQTNIAMRMVHILSGPGNIRRTLFIRLFFARLESSKELTIFLEIDTMLLGCSKCCHSRRPTVIFYFSLFLAVLNLECFGIILTDK